MFGDIALCLLLGCAVYLCIYAHRRPKRRVYAPLKIVKERHYGARFNETPEPDGEDQK